MLLSGLSHLILGLLLLSNHQALLQSAVWLIGNMQSFITHWWPNLWLDWLQQAPWPYVLLVLGCFCWGVLYRLCHELLEH